MKLPTAITGRKYKEGAVVKFVNPFRKNKEKSTPKKTVLEKYYNIKPIDDTNAVYRMIIGQRSNRQNLFSM